MKTTYCFADLWKNSFAIYHRISQKGTAKNGTNCCIAVNAVFISYDKYTTYKTTATV